MFGKESLGDSEFINPVLLVTMPLSCELILISFLLESKLILELHVHLFLGSFLDEGARCEILD